MITFRPFLNTDPPAIVSIWRSQPKIRGRLHSITEATLEEFVFAKPYFDREGFIVATEDGMPVGFAHAALGPNETLTSVGSETGVVCQVLVNPRWDTKTIAPQLIQQAEKYLTQFGVKQIVAGGYKPNDPFYLGIYGGSRLPGILTDESELIEMFRAAGFKTQRVQTIMQCMLNEFVPRIDRRQMMVKRKYEIKADTDPTAHSWWEACTMALTDSTRFFLSERGASQPCGEVTFWDMRPLSTNWGMRATGIFDLKVDAGFRRNGLATYLICEGMKQLTQQGVAVAEVQTDANDAATIALFEKLRFHKIDEGVVLVKSTASESSTTS